MKRATLFFGVVLAVVMFMPHQSQAAIPFPNDKTDSIIGVTEETFHALQEAECNIEGPCDPLLKQFDNILVMRVESKGQKYWVKTADGLPFVTRYFSDGFYHAKNRQYLVSNGFRVRFTEKNAYEKLLNVAQYGGNGGSLRTGVTEDTFSELTQNCTHDEAASQYVGCETGEEMGENDHIANALANRIIQRVETDGSLYYVRKLVNSNVYDVVQLKQQMGAGSFYDFIKNESKYNGVKLKAIQNVAAYSAL